LITGSPSLNTVIDAKLYGATAYFPKPLNLEFITTRVRQFLGDRDEPVQGHVLVLGQALWERLGARLGGLASSVCAEEESAFLAAVRERQPKAILADVASASTPGLLRAYQSLGPEANSFVLLGDDSVVDRLSDLAFEHAGTACLSLGASQAELTRDVRNTIAQRDAEKLRAQSDDPVQANKCPFAQAYRHGYYCASESRCPHGAFQDGWICVGSKEYQKCRKRPLLVESSARAGHTACSGSLGPAASAALAKQLLRLVHEGKREIVIDAEGLDACTDGLVAGLLEARAALAEASPAGTLRVFNLAEDVREELRKRLSGAAIRVYGPRMVDESSRFKQWGSHFD
jgi:hypothetical protein